MRHLVLDIETCAHDCAADYIPKPDLDSIQAAGNLKDPIKIAESIETRRRTAVLEHDASLRKAALDWNLSRIVAIAWASDASHAVTVRLCKDEADETDALIDVWAAFEQARFIAGFAARTFDVPTLIQRSRLLGVPFPRVSLARYGNGTVVDLREILTFDDARYEALMPRSLKAFCRRFGIPVDDPVDGSEIPALVAAGNWAAVEAHVTSDVRLTLALGRRIGVFPALASNPEPPRTMSAEQEAVGF